MRLRKIIYCLAVCASISTSAFSQIKILFDAAHGESAGNADWVIDADLHNMGWGSTGGYTCTCASTESNAQRLPTPTQTAVTTSTSETYWAGAISHWAIDCVNKGYWVETLPFGTPLSYGTSLTQDLSKYNIFIVTEPNVLFTTAEKTAMMNFVLNGGSLLMISDHDASDRNGDGFDSPRIWNDFISNNGVSNNTVGFNFALENFSGTYTNVVNAPSDSLLHGPYGSVTKVQWSGGTCMNIFPAQNASAKAIIYRNGVVQGDSAALVVYANVGCGKVAAIGDSSPADDGTGDPNDTSLYDGYITDAAGNHQKLLMNMVIWLAKQNCFTTIAEAVENNKTEVFPNPATNSVTVIIANSSDRSSVLTVFSMNGQVVEVSQKQSREGGNEQFVLNTSALSAGVYYCKITIADRTITQKLIVTKS